MLRHNQLAVQQGVPAAQGGSGVQAGDIQTMEAQLQQANMGIGTSPAIASPSPAAAGETLFPSVSLLCTGCASRESLGFFYVTG